MAHQALSLLDYKVVNEKPPQNKEFSAPKMLERLTRGRQPMVDKIVLWPFKIMVLRPRQKNGLSSSKSWAEEVNHVASVPSSKEWKSDSSSMDSGTYQRVCYSSNNGISKTALSLSSPSIENRRLVLRWKETFGNYWHIWTVTTLHSTKKSESVEHFKQELL